MEVSGGEGKYIRRVSTGNKRDSELGGKKSRKRRTSEKGCWGCGTYVRVWGGGGGTSS